MPIETRSGNAVGYKVRREIRDTLQPGLLTSAERLVLLEIADLAGDETRIAKFGPDDVAKMVDMTAQAVRKHVQRIEAKGINLRIPIGIDRNGKPVFAHEGRQTNYRVPLIKTSEGGQSVQALPVERVDSPSQEDGQTVPRGWTESTKRVDKLSTPSPQVSSSNPQRSLSQATTPDSLLTELGADERERDELIQKIKNECQPQTLGWWITASRNGTLLGHLEAHRAGGSTGSGMPAWCGTCDKDTRQIETEDQYGGGTRPRRCPDCHPSVVRQPPPARRQNNGWGGPFLNSTDPHAFDGYKPHARENVNAYQPYRDDPTRDYHAPL